MLYLIYFNLKVIVFNSIYIKANYNIVKGIRYSAQNLKRIFFFKYIYILPIDRSSYYYLYYYYITSILVTIRDIIAVPRDALRATPGHPSDVR